MKNNEQDKGEELRFAFELVEVVEKAFQEARDTEETPEPLVLRAVTTKMKEFIREGVDLETK